MSTFTVDLITGNIYLFNNDFSSGSTPTSGMTYPEVSVYSELPLPSLVSGKIYVVRQGSDSYALNRKPAGFYFSTGTAWKYLGEAPADLLRSDHFQILDNIDSTKGAMFITSGITSGIFRTLTIQDSDGTIAYLTDLATKVDLSVFADYTGNTAPNQFVSKISFNSFTGTTAPAIYLTKSAFNTYSGTTVPATYLAKTVFNNYSASTITNQIQLTHTGGTNINTITPTTIIWHNAEYSGNSFTWNGGTKIKINKTADYEVSYHIPYYHTGTNNIRGVGANLMLNGTTSLTNTASAATTARAGVVGNLVLSNIVLSLNKDDILNLIVFRTGLDGTLNTLANGAILIKEKNKLQ